MSKSIKMEEISKADHYKAFLLHNKHNVDQRIPSEWEHEYLGYKPSKMVFTLLKDKEEIIGTLGMLPINIMFKKKKLLSAKGENALIDPEYRSGNLFKDFYSYTIECSQKKGLKLIWGLTNLGLVWNRILKFKAFDTIFQNVIGLVGLRNFRIIVNFFVASPSNKSRRKGLVKIKFGMLILGFRFLIVLKSIPTHFRFNQLKKNYEVTDALKSENDIQLLFQKLTEKNPDLIYIDQDEKYRKWRIENNPRLKYLKLFLYKNEQITGYCYISLDEENKIGYLTDITCLEEDDYKFLLNLAFRKLKKRGLSIIRYLGNKQNELIGQTLSLLKKCGFLLRNIPTSFVVKDIANIDDESL